MKLQPVFPFCVEAPGPEQMPEGPAQHLLAQSASLMHWPPMNCINFWLPTFFWPAGSKGGPPLEAVGGGGAGEDDAGVDNELDPPPKWQPVFPFWVEAPGPEQMPEGPAQHLLAQSASLRHWPPMNCVPFLLPTFFCPAGSKGGPPLGPAVGTGGGEEATKEAKANMVAVIVMDFII
jgi:hypothetical protein